MLVPLRRTYFPPGPGVQIPRIQVGSELTFRASKIAKQSTARRCQGNNTVTRATRSVLAMCPGALAPWNCSWRWCLQATRRAVGLGAPTVITSGALPAPELFRTPAFFFVPIAVVASGIASRHNHHNARVPCRFRSLAQRIIVIRFEHGRPRDRLIYADVVRVFKFDRPLNRSDHLAVRAGSIGVKHAQADDVGIRGHARVVLGVAAL